MTGRAPQRDHDVRRTHRPTTTYASRIGDFQKFSTRSAWLAGGVVALLAVASGLGTYFFRQGSGALGAALLTVTLLAGACAAFARVKFEWAGVKLQRLLDAGEKQGSDPIDEDWEKRAERLMIAAVLLLALAGAMLVVLSWITAV